MLHHVNDLYVETFKRVKEVQRTHGTAWAAFTSFPFFYSLSTKVVGTVKRRSPELIKRQAVWTWECLAGALELTASTSKSVAVTTIRTTARACHATKEYISETEPPRPLQPIKYKLILPMFEVVEEAVQFVLSDDIIELYEVARAKIVMLPFGPTLILPIMTAAETTFRILVLVPSRPMYYVSREAVATGADRFIDISKTRYQAIVERLYSATVVIDRIDTHLNKAQWNLLGWGRYSEVTEEARKDILLSMYQRWSAIDTPFKKYEFLAYLRAHSADLYTDILATFPGLTGSGIKIEDVDKESDLYIWLLEHEMTTIPCWFLSRTDSRIWEKFPPHEARRLERAYQKLQSSPDAPCTVRVDEGRHEVDLKKWTRSPVYWPSLGDEDVRRSIWLYMERNYELMPYSIQASELLEEAFLFLVSHLPDLKESSLTNSYNARRKGPLLTVQVEDQTVEFYSPIEIIAVKKILAGTTFLYSRRRVYRGDPRPRNDKAEMELWTGIKRGKEDSHNDDADLDAPVDHLVFVVHGIGDALRTVDFNVVTLRSIMHCADNLRSMHKDSMNSPEFSNVDGKEKRVEFLPVEWHTKLHNEAIGIDDMIKRLTLRTIPKLREFANDSLLDVLFYLSPSFHQLILDEVTEEMNRLYDLYVNNHPSFSGKVSIVGHSLGSVVCFDILANQEAVEGGIARERTASNAENYSSDGDTENKIVPASLFHPSKVSWGLKGRERLERQRPPSLESLASELQSSVSAAAQTPLKGEEGISVTPPLLHVSSTDNRCNIRPRSSRNVSLANQRHLNDDDEEGIEGRKSAVRISDVSLKDAVVSAGSAWTAMLMTSPDVTPRGNGSPIERGYPSRPGSLRGSSRITAGECEGPSPVVSSPADEEEQGESELSESSSQEATRRVTYAATSYKQLHFSVENFFSLGSPLGMFIKVRGQALDNDFRLPTCQRFFNIFHPYDPVAYRMEPIFAPDNADVEPVIIPTFHGRLRIHYQVKEAVKNLWFNFISFKSSFERTIENAVQKVGLIEEDIPRWDAYVSATRTSRKMRYGSLNRGLRLDYSLQENEVEVTTEYLFAITAHVIYWTSKDVSLFIAKNLFSAQEELQSSAEIIESMGLQNVLEEAMDDMATAARNEEQTGSNQLDEDHIPPLHTPSAIPIPEAQVPLALDDSRGW